MQLIELVLQRLVLAQGDGERRAQRHAVGREQRELLADALQHAAEPVATLVAEPGADRRQRGRRRRCRPQQAPIPPRRPPPRLPHRWTAMPRPRRCPAHRRRWSPAIWLAPDELEDRRRVPRRLDLDELVDLVGLGRDAAWRQRRCPARSCRRTGRASASRSGRGRTAGAASRGPGSGSRRSGSASRTCTRSGCTGPRCPRACSGRPSRRG